VERWRQEEDYRAENVATPKAWRRGRSLVQRFYNESLKAILGAKLNEGHSIIAD